MYAQTVGLHPVGRLIQALSGGTQLRGARDQQRLRAAVAPGIHAADLPLRIFFHQLLRHDAGGLIRPAEARRERQKQHVPSLLQWRLQQIDEILHPRLRGGIQLLLFLHAAVKALGRHISPVQIGLFLMPVREHKNPMQIILHAETLPQIPRQVAGRVRKDGKIRHFYFLLFDMDSLYYSYLIFSRPKNVFL